jgi:hypothetical protein
VCTVCVAEGIGYVGASVGVLRFMATRAAHRRAAMQSGDGEVVTDGAAAVVVVTRSTATDGSVTAPS